MPSSSDIDTPSHTLQYSICFIVILVVIFTNLSLPTINPHCWCINLQWGYFKLEDNQKDVENIISLPLTVKNNYLTWVNKHGTLIYTNMFYTVAPDKTNFRFYTNTVGGYMWGSIGFI